MKTKRRLIIAVGILVFVLPGWFLYQQARVWLTPVPRWVVSGAGQQVSDCEAAALVHYQALPVADAPPNAITRAQAVVLAERVLAGQIGLAGYSLSGGPMLVQAIFPDEQQRLAWAYVVIVDDGGSTLSGNAAVVYLDALAAEPLLLVTDMRVGDPLLGCDAIGLRITPVFARWPLILFSVYLVLIVVVIGVRRHNRRAAQRDESGT